MKSCKNCKYFYLVEGAYCCDVPYLKGKSKDFFLRSLEICDKYEKTDEKKKDLTNIINCNIDGEYYE